MKNTKNNISTFYVFKLYIYLLGSESRYMTIVEKIMSFEHYLQVAEVEFSPFIRNPNHTHASNLF